MRVGILVDNLIISGGTQRAALIVAKYLQQQGHDITVYSYWYDPQRCYPELTKALDVRGVFERQPKASGGVARLLMLMQRPFVRVRWAFAFMAQLDSDIDILYGWGHKTQEALWAFKRQTGQPTVWCCPDLPYYFRVGFTEGFYQQSNFSTLPYLAYRLSDFLNQSVDRQIYMRGVDDIVVHVTKNSHLIKSRFGRSSHVIYPAVDTAHFTYRPKPPRHKRAFRMASIAGFYRYRRFEDLIQAVAILQKQGHEIELTIGGYQASDPAYAKELKELSQSLGLEKSVSFRSALTEDELREVLWQSDAFLWSNHNQSWGVIVSEAIACGTPVIVSRTSGISEILTDKRHALLVPPLAPENFANAIAKLINEPEFANQLVRQAMDEVLPLLRIERHCAENQKLLERMYNQHKKTLEKAM